MIEVTPAELKRFQALILSTLGIDVDAGDPRRLEDVLRHHLAQGNHTRVTGWLDSLQDPLLLHREMRALADALTVGETYFFRHSAQFQAFAEVALPERLRARRDCRQLNLLSAGCATGEEPYSLAILLREHMPDLAGWKVSILGIDVNPAVIERARAGRYMSWSLRETPPELRERYFRKEGNHYQLDPAIVSMVTFEERNLASESLFLPREQFDVIFCRNVLIYFGDHPTRALVRRIERATMPGGFLFLGHAETLRGLTEGYHLRHTHEVFYYQRLETTAERDRGPLVAPSPAPIDAVEAPGSSWMHEIVRSAERVSSLVGRAGVGGDVVVTGHVSEGPEASASASPSAGPGATAAAGDGRAEPAGGIASQWDLEPALELVRHERFREALEWIEALPLEAATDRGVMLVQAALLTNQGDLRAAEAICERLLELDELNPGAHYLAALCRQQAGDPAAARRHDQAAIHLDPGFAMAYLHLGLLSRREGNLEAALQAFERALTLLRLEEPGRLLLFGGGFGREALLQVCRTHLLACGGGP